MVHSGLARVAPSVCQSSGYNSSLDRLHGPHSGYHLLLLLSRWPASLQGASSPLHCIAMAVFFFFSVFYHCWTMFIVHQVSSLNVNMNWDVLDHIRRKIPTPGLDFNSMPVLNSMLCPARLWWAAWCQGGSAPARRRGGPGRRRSRSRPPSSTRSKTTRRRKQRSRKKAEETDSLGLVCCATFKVFLGQTWTWAQWTPAMASQRARGDHTELLLRMRKLQRWQRRAQTWRTRPLPRARWHRPPSPRDRGWAQRGQSRLWWWPAGFLPLSHSGWCWARCWPLSLFWKSQPMLLSNVRNHKTSQLQDVFVFIMVFVLFFYWWGHVK